MQKDEEASNWLKRLFQWVKEFIESLGGTITVNDNPKGQGTKFEILREIFFLLIDLMLAVKKFAYEYQLFGYSYKLTDYLDDRTMVVKHHFQERLLERLGYRISASHS